MLKLRRVSRILFQFFQVNIYSGSQNIDWEIHIIFATKTKKDILFIQLPRSTWGEFFYNPPNISQIQQRIGNTTQQNWWNSKDHFPSPMILRFWIEREPKMSFLYFSINFYSYPTIRRHMHTRSSSPMLKIYLWKYYWFWIILNVIFFMSSSI